MRLWCSSLRSPCCLRRIAVVYVEEPSRTALMVVTRTSLLAPRLATDPVLKALLVVEAAGIAGAYALARRSWGT